MLDRKQERAVHSNDDRLGRGYSVNDSRRPSGSFDPFFVEGEMRFVKDLTQREIIVGLA